MVSIPDFWDLYSATWECWPIPSAEEHATMPVPNAIQREALAYVKNTNGGATKQHFIEDHAPVGAHLWVDLRHQGWVEERGEGRRLFLTEAGAMALSLPKEREPFTW